MTALHSASAPRRAALAAAGAALVSLGALGRTLRAQDSSATPATLRGVVSDARTGHPLGDATVIVAGTLLRTRTSVRGEYRVSGVPPGRRMVRVLRIGYRSATREFVAPSADTVQVDVAMPPVAVQLAPVTVTSSRVEHRVGDVPASEAVMSGAEVARRNVITLDQALPFVPGVLFNHGDVDIRGASGLAGGVGSRVLVLLDGHPVLTADGGEVDFASLPLLDVDRVEVVKGAYSALYGSNALGGVVNVVTSPVGDEAETVVSAHYGAFAPPSRYRFTGRRLDFSGLALQHSRRVGDVGVRLLVDRETSDGFRQDDRSDRWLLRGKVELPSPATRPSFAYAVYSAEDDGNFFTWRDAGHPYEVPPATADDWARNSKLSVGATLVPVATGSRLVEVTPYLERDATQNHFHGGADSTDYHRATKVGTGVQLSLLPRGGRTLTLGAEVGHTLISSNFLGRAAADTSTRFVGHPTLDDGGIFAQAELPATHGVSGAIGARLDAHRATGSSADVSLSPKAGVLYRPVPWLAARASIAHGYRAPSAIEQFVSTTQQGFHVIPNPDLHGETAWSAEIGATGTPWDWLWLDAALFQSEYRGLIAPASAPAQPFVFQFRNVQRARVRGVDLSVKAAIRGGAVTTQLSYVYVDSRDLDTHLALPYRSRHNLTGSVDVLGGLLGVDVRYRSRVQEVLVYPLDPRGAFTVVDVRAAYRVLGTTLQARVANALQASYVDVMERTLGPPRSVLLTAMRTF